MPFREFKMGRGAPVVGGLRVTFCPRLLISLHGPGICLNKPLWTILANKVLFMAEANDFLCLVIRSFSGEQYYSLTVVNSLW